MQARAVGVSLKVPASASSPIQQLVRGTKNSIPNFNVNMTHYIPAAVLQLLLSSKRCSLSSCSIRAAWLPVPA
jgi:hypothetical protein